LGDGVALQWHVGQADGLLFKLSGSWGPAHPSAEGLSHGSLTLGVLIRLGLR
jgi:hypothetical protein